MLSDRKRAIIQKYLQKMDVASKERHIAKRELETILRQLIPHTRICKIKYTKQALSNEYNLHVTIHTSEITQDTIKTIQDIAEVYTIIPLDKSEITINIFQFKENKLIK